MKKFIAVCAVLLFVAPAFAAEWAFYGSERVGSWYKDRDYGDDLVINGQKDDQATELAFQGNSRLGAKVKADKVTGQIELSLSAGGSGSGGDGAVGTRRAYGTWKFADDMALKVGKDYSPVTDFISNQMVDGDADLLGVGNFYGRRPAGLTLILGNFELAALTPSYGYDVGTTGGTGIYALNTAGTALSSVSSGDADSYIPRFEASYNLKLGAGYIKPFGGFQYYEVEQSNSTVLQKDIEVWSWVAGVSTSWNIGAFSIGGQVSYGANQGAVEGWAPGVNQTGSTLSGSQSRSGSSPILKDNGEDIEDTYTTQALLVGALKFTDTIRLEVGGGYRVDESDLDGAKKDEVWSAYLQVMFTLAPGVYLVPEVGYFDFMEDGFGNDQGTQWYGGAKWQIDF